MEGEVYNLVIDWSIALASLLYCHGVTKLIAQGTTRFLALFPVLCLFLYLPLNLTTMILCGPSFFYMSWLGSFKLLLLAFDHGPLSSKPPLPLSQFILSACLPIKIISTKSRIQETPSYNIKNSRNPISQNQNQEFKKPHLINSRIQEIPSQKITKESPKSPKDYVIRFILLLITIKVYGYKDHVHPLFTTPIYAYFVFIALETLLAVAASMARTLAGVELEPQFDKPHQATSVQNFWGKRWNLMVSSILRPTVYHPARAVFSHVVPKRWVSVPAVLATFLVSGIMHEMIFYYLGRLPPTWEVTWFFIIHGVWVGTEIMVKKTVGHLFEPAPVVARLLTLSFVMVTSFWLFFPPYLRLNPHVRFCREVMAFLEFLKHGHLLTPNDFVCPYNI